MCQCCAILRNGQYYRFITCACFSMLKYSKEEYSSAHIPVYYSEEDLKKAGWECTSDLKFCPPGQSYAWVCPECWQEKGSSCV